jgi:hypothetical protein
VLGGAAAMYPQQDAADRVVASGSEFLLALTEIKDDTPLNVFGEITAGAAAAERLVSGDVITRVVIRAAGAR